MWARTVELILGIWLGISWIIFKYENSDVFLYINDFSCFFLIGCFSLLSYLEKLRHIHLFNFAIAIWLGAFSYYIRHIGLDPFAQNYMMVAFLLLMLSIIPSHSKRPPYQWIKHMNKHL